MLAAAPGRALAADPYEEAYTRGEALEKQGDLPGAATAYEEALGKKGAPAHIHLKIAKLWLRLGKGRGALKEVDGYRKAEPSPSEKMVQQMHQIEAAARAMLPAPKPPRSKLEAKRVTEPEKTPEPQQAAAAAVTGPLPETKERAAMVLIEPGSFQMGSPKTEEDRDDDEVQHPVRISRAYLLGQTEVTQGQYQAVLGSNPSDNKASPKHPVENVSWVDAVQYCNKLSEKEGLPACYTIKAEEVRWPEGLKCRGYRLPTEAEWEYAARAGQGTLYAGSDTVDEVAWTDDKTHADKKRPNAWNLYNMSGNVWEWVWDWKAVYQSGTDPFGPDSGVGRVCRGGSSWFDARGQRVAHRFANEPSFRNVNLGFRVARSLP